MQDLGFLYKAGALDGELALQLMLTNVFAVYNVERDGVELESAAATARHARLSACAFTLACSTFAVLASLHLKSGTADLVGPLTIFSEWLASDGIILVSDSNFELPVWKSALQLLGQLLLAAGGGAAEGGAADAGGTAKEDLEVEGFLPFKFTHMRRVFAAATPASVSAVPGGAGPFWSARLRRLRAQLAGNHRERLAALWFDGR